MAQMIRDQNHYHCDHQDSPRQLDLDNDGRHYDHPDRHVCHYDQNLILMLIMVIILILTSRQTDGDFRHLLQLTAIDDRCE